MEDKLNKPPNGMRSPGVSIHSSRCNTPVSEPAYFTPVPIPALDEISAPINPMAPSTFSSRSVEAKDTEGEGRAEGPTLSIEGASNTRIKYFFSHLINVISP